MARVDEGTIGTPDHGGGEVPRPALRGTVREGRKAKIVQLLAERKVPAKDDVLRVKRLIRDLAGDSSEERAEEMVTNFVSAYLDIYLARITGDESLEKDGLRRCLAELRNCDGTTTADIPKASEQVVRFPRRRR